MKLNLPLALAGSLLLAGYAQAEIEHYRGLPAETLEQAVANFSEYNQKLGALVEKEELTPQDIDKVHELTYTLENALERIQDELDLIAELLEEVHVGSETLQYEQVQQSGRAYLEKARTLIE